MAEDGRQRVDLPRGVRRSLATLVLLACVVALDSAQPMLMPVVAALLLSFVLAPVVASLERAGVPRGLASAALVFMVVFTIASVAYLLIDPAQGFLRDLPDRLTALEGRLRTLQGSVETVSEAAESVSEITNGNDGPQEVTVREGSPLMSLLGSAGALMASTLFAVALTFFFLLDGRNFLLRLVKTLPSLKARKRALRVAASIRGHASQYLLSITVINAALAAILTGWFWLLGLPTPLLWGVMAGVLNYIPYVGSMTGIATVAIVSFTMSDPSTHPVLAPAGYLVLTSLEGTLLTPAVLGRSMRLNPAAVLLAVLFWGWLWGVPGALLAVPLLATMKVVADAYPGLGAVGQMLGR